MRKQEFLQALRRALTGDVPPGVVEENIRYYDGYITEEVGRGRPEEEVIQEIGDPRLIARTIEDTTDGSGDGSFRTGGAYEYDQSDPWSRTEEYRQDDPMNMEMPFHVFRLDKWYWKLLLALIVVGVLYLVITIIGGIFSLIAPFIGPLLVIWLLVSIFRKDGKW